MREPRLSNPDFELYANVGRTTEQIHSYNTDTPSTDDVLRWARADAQPLIDAAQVQPSGAGIADWAALLGEAATTGQFCGITAAFVDDDKGALGRLHQFLEAAANWHDEHGNRIAAQQYTDVANHFSSLADDLFFLTGDLAREAHQRSTGPDVQVRPTMPPPPPQPPGARSPHR